MTERTPAGGNRSDIIHLDATGAQTTPDKAVAVEIREYADGVMIRRSYLERTTTLPAYTPAGEVRAEPDVADVTKNTWSVYQQDADGMVRLATTVESLLDAVGEGQSPVERQRAFLVNLMTLPSWAAAPDELKQDVTQWLARH